MSADELGPGPCLTPEQLLAHLAAATSAESDAAIIRHAERCLGCQRLLGRLLRGIGAAEGPTATQAGEDEPGAALAGPEVVERGATLGDYVVLEPIGSGAMGRVFLALHAQLSRLVALKLMSLPSNARAKKATLSRVLREGRALARLNHPNVVTVHSVGEARGHAFVAMELVRGGTLRAWASTQRPWRKVLAVLVQAGRGLSAAHHAGLVHRDFKPDNVLVGEDGIARVTDFGMARSLLEPADLGPLAESAPAAIAVPEPMTLTGALIGTPAYMAPEQLRGAPADVASDQFSFCVTAFECLFGARPFQGETLEALRRSIEEQRTFKVPRSSPVPRRVLRLLTRGLSASAAARHRTLDDLLDALEPRRRRWAPWLVAATTVLAAAAITAAALLPGRREAALCDESARWQGVWDAVRRAQVEQAFARTALPYAAPAFKQLRAVLDDYTHRWTDTQRQVCLAASVTASIKSQYELLCLRQRREDVNRLILELSAGDRAVVAKAAELSMTLPPLSSCELASETVARPALGAPDAGQVAGLQSSLARARLAWRSGRLDEAERLALDVVAKAEPLNLRPVLAEARLVLGEARRQLRREGEDASALFAAAIEAETAGLEALAAEGWIALAAASRLRPRETPDRWLALAELAVRRAGSPPDLEATLMSQRGFQQLSNGKIDGALELQTRATRLLESRYGPTNLRAASSNYRLAISLGMLGRCKEAEPLLRAVAAAREAALSAVHPSTWDARETLAICLQRTGRAGEALPLFEEILGARAEASGIESPAYLTALSNYAGTLKDLGRYEEALSAVQKAAELREKAYGPSDVRVATQVLNVGLVLSEMRRYGEALPKLRRARALYEASGGGGALEGGMARIYVAETLMELGKFPEALTELEPVSGLSPDLFAHVAFPFFVAQGRAFLGVGRRAQAAAVLERARALPADDLTTPRMLEKMKALLAEARSGAGPEQRVLRAK